MYVVGVFYHLHGDHAWATAALKGVAAGGSVTERYWDVATVGRRFSLIVLVARSAILKRAAPQHLSHKVSAGNELLR